MMVLNEFILMQLLEVIYEGCHSTKGGHCFRMMVTEYFVKKL